METININPINSQHSYSINRQDLMSAESVEVNDSYSKTLQNLANAVTSVIDNNSTAKIENAIDLFDLSPIQTDILNHFKLAFQETEKKMEPDKIDFSISKAMDNEICLNKFTKEGVSKIIINDDGFVVYSFIAFATSNKQDIFNSLGVIDAAFDFEKLTYNFLSF